MNYIKINTNNLINNINNIKNNYKFKYYIYNVSNNAFNCGIYIVNYLNNKDILYTSFFNDVLLIRKYNNDIKIIYSGDVIEDNVYDLVLNNVIFLVKDIKTIDELINYKIKDNINIILNIDVYNGFYSKNDIINIIDKLSKFKHINIVGIKSVVKEKDYNTFLDIIKPLKNLDYVVLNNEEDKNKIKMSNSILLENSLYGFNCGRKDIIKPIFSVISKVDKIIEKKRKKLAVVPFSINTNNVVINNKKYKVINSFFDYSLVEIDDTVKIGDTINIYTNESYNLPIIYDDYILDKTFTY